MRHKPAIIVYGVANFKKWWVRRHVLRKPYTLWTLPTYYAAKW